MATYHRNTIEPCARDIYENGICAGMYDPSYISGQEFETLVRETQRQTGKRCDWSTFAGRFALRCFKEDRDIIIESFNKRYISFRKKRFADEGIDISNTTGTYNGE